MKNKTLAAWLAFIGGPIGLHRFYLFGASDTVGWILPVPTLLGLYGVQHAQRFGLDDSWIGLLISLLGLCIAGCALNAIVYGLMSTEKWNQRFNPGAPSEAPNGQTNWFTIAAVVAALLVGSITLIASIAFGFQRYFEHQIEAAPKVPK